ncbi:MAG: serine hydrolase domain-containing protein [Sphingosinicella sp.]|uniref:serine hydrolase domain-containing protein n=1 Tax=Sphingosinicella sp. TaxID=1917971 RepID=UPI0040383517
MRLFWMAILAALAAPACATTQPQDPDLGALVDAHVANGFSGAVLAARGDEVLLSRGADDRFWIASTAKQFVAAAVVKLVEQGRLGLDDPLSRFFPDAPADKAAITLRQLLSHMSGIGQSYVSERLGERAPAVAAMFAEPLAGPPGSGFRYSNSNIQLAVAVVEAVSGMSYPEFARSVLWAPAGLADTGFAGGEVTATVSPIEGALPPRLIQGFWGGEGVFSSAHDLYRWVRALRSGRAMRRASADLMFAPVQGATISEGAAALGWFVGHAPSGATRVFIRGNEDFGANSLIYYYPEHDITIIVLTHAGDAGELSWSRTVHADVERALGL